MNFRPLTLEDHPELMRIVANWQPKVPSLRTWNESIVRRSLQSEVRGLAAENNGKLVGFLLASRNPEAWEIQLIAVDIAQTRQRVGKGLLAQFTKLVQEFIKMNGKQAPQRVWLEVASDNAAALEFYLQFGFQQVGLRPRYYRSADAILLEFQVPSAGLPP